MAAVYPENPYLQGNFAPLRTECDVENLVVVGEIPADLNGTLYRNCPDPQFAPRGEHHWFAGDGMIHAFHIREGKVSYRNRWARTPKFEAERAAGEALINPFNPLDNDPRAANLHSTLANTNVVWHGGRLLALEEAHLPWELDPHTLESKGYYDFSAGLSGPVTAHPKIDPKTGQMLCFGYSAKGYFTPEIAYYEVNPDGVLTRSELFTAPYVAMVHDFITTSEHVLFPIMPLTGSIERAMQGLPAFAWEPEKGAFVGVMRRDQDVESMRWFQTDPCFVFHPMNAWTEGDKIHADVMKHEVAPLFPNADGSPISVENGKSGARLFRWTLDMAANSDRIQEQQLGDQAGEFPRCDERRTGLSYRHGYYAKLAADNLTFTDIIHHDHDLGRCKLFHVPDSDRLDEPVFVPRNSDALEGQGYLLATVYRGAEKRTDLLILDAENVDGKPLAVARLAHRVPHGFHGNWRPDTH